MKFRDDVELLSL